MLNKFWCKPATPLKHAVNLSCCVSLAWTVKHVWCVPPLPSRFLRSHMCPLRCYVFKTDPMGAVSPFTRTNEFSMQSSPWFCCSPKRSKHTENNFLHAQQKVIRRQENAWSQKASFIHNQLLSFSCSIHQLIGPWRPKPFPDDCHLLQNRQCKIVRITRSSCPSANSAIPSKLFRAHFGRKNSSIIAVRAPPKHERNYTTTARESPSPLLTTTATAGHALDPSTCCGTSK